MAAASAPVFLIEDAPAPTACTNCGGVDVVTYVRSERCKPAPFCGECGRELPVVMLADRTAAQAGAHGW